MSEGRHRASPRTLIAGGIAALAVVGVAALLLAKGGGPSSVVRTTPAFSFSVDKAIGSSSEPGVRDVDVEDRVAEVAADAAPFLDALFSAAFLDPANRSDGTYADVWTFFADDARPSAEAAIETLTLGSLGPLFDDVQPGRGSIRARVLLGPGGITQLVAAEVTFRATASPGGDGVRAAEIKSIGEFVLRPVGDGWTVIAFRVRRVDENLPVVGAPQ